jgi:hypothetical protein
MNSKIRFICQVNDETTTWKQFDEYSYKRLDFKNSRFGDKVIISTNGIEIYSDYFWLKEVPKSCRDKIKLIVIELWEDALGTKRFKQITKKTTEMIAKLDAIGKLCGDR